MKVRKGTIKKPKFIPIYIISTVILLLVFTVLALFPFLGSYMDYEYNSQEYRELSSVDRRVVNYLYEGDTEKDELSGADISGIKNILILNYLSYGQRYRIHLKDGSVIDSSRTAILDYSVLKNNVTELVCSYELRLADEKYLKYLDTPEVNAFKTIDAPRDGELEYFECTDDELSHLLIKCDEFYADFDKGVFIPVELEICTFTNGQSDYTPTGVVVRFDPEDTDGYTLIKTQDGVSQGRGIIAGYEGPDNDEEYTEFGISENGLITKREWTPLVPIPFTKAYRKEIITGLVVIVLAALAFAFIPATISYNIKKRRFEVYEYRLKMVDSMAHDLKTPMAALSAYSENLSNNIATDKKEYYAGKIEEKVSQMNTMVNDMLEFSKSENKSAVITKEDVDISDVITGIISGNEHAITERSLKINYDKKSVVLKTDKKLFEQAISNLINNAVLYSKEGTAIDIACEGNTLTITNISAEKLEDVKSLKQAFAKGSLSRGSKGTGLGLAIADNNLAMLKYKLDIKSDGEKFIATVKL